MKKSKLNVARIFINSLLFLILSTAAWAASPGPAIFYSDLTAGPNTGGQNNNGVFVTIWGNNFGSAQGSSYITVGGGKVNNYPTWTNTMICFQLGSSTATGNIVLVSSNGNATGPLFTVQAGNIYFVQPGASSNGSGAYTSPFNHLYYAEQIVNPGDAVYVMAGTINDEEDGHPGWHTLLMQERAGTQASPISWVAYPNAKVTLQADGGAATWIDGASGGGDNVQYIFRGYTNWQTISKFYLVFTGSNANLTSIIDSTGNDGWKVVGNNMTASYYTYCITCLAGNYSSVLGNEIHDSGAGQSFNNEDHSIYWDGGGSNVEIGWNYLHGNKNAGWEISTFHQGSSSEPTRVGTIHDNLIVANTAGAVKGILLGDVDSGENQADAEGQVIKVYNNVLNDLGQYENGGAIQAVSGTGYIYNNTIYQSPDNEGTIQFPSGGIGPGGGHPVWYVANNIIYNSLSSSLYLSDGNGNAPTWGNFALVTSNNYYGAGNGPSQDSKAVNANPQFVSAGTNFQLQAASPDINAGYNIISVVAKDLNGLLRDSTPSIGAYEYTSATTTSSPTVSITSPSSGVSLTIGSNVGITASASETNGTISNIAIYNGSTLLGSSSSSPYTYTMSDPAIGTYTLTAKATDAKGVSTASSPVTAVVIPLPILPSSPVVNITSPTSGSSYSAGSDVTITTTASETNGTISNISLYNGSGVLLGSSSKSPYSFVDANLLAGTYTFYAVAKDANGVSTTSSSITITVTALAAPVVSITSPSNGSSVTTGSTVTINASASETSGVITKVAFYNGTILLATDTASPYSYAWANVPAGTYSLTAVATGSNGTSTTSPAVSFAAGTHVAPAVSLTSPTNNASYAAPANITITANTSAASGSTITKVAFYNGTVLLGTDTASPYSFTWSNVAAGTYSLTAVATDSTGASTTSPKVSVSVSSHVAPAVSLTSPTNNSSYTAPGSITVTANASAASGSVITKVEFYNGTVLLGTDTASPYTFTWSNVAAGTYSLTAVATDSTGASTTSPKVSVSVSSHVAPAVSLTSPTNNSSYTAPGSITVTANASAASGSVITKVEFYNGTVLLGTDTASPYTFTWSNVAAGTYSLTAVATDSTGASTTSPKVSVTVNAANNARVAPAVTMTSPSTYTAPANIILSASASATNATITKVAFYNGTTLLATDTSSPYTYTWTNVPVGTYSLTAVATDSTGATTTSAKVSAIVNAPSLPVVAITGPTNGTSFTAGSSTTVTATASEANGSIAQVAFYNGTTLLATDTASPYTYTWSNMSAGTYAITAVATDAKGVSVTSSPVSVAVTVKYFLG